MIVCLHDVWADDNRVGFPSPFMGAPGIKFGLPSLSSKHFQLANPILDPVKPWPSETIRDRTVELRSDFPSDKRGRVKLQNGTFWYVILESSWVY